MYDDEINERNQKILLAEIKFWVLELLVEMAEQYERSFKTIVENLKISDKDQKSTDYLRGFGEGIQILIGLFVQDFLYYPRFYGFSDVPDRVINRYDNYWGLNRIPEDNQVVSFLKEINNWLKDLDSGKKKQFIHEILDDISSTLKPMIDQQQESIEVVNTGSDKKMLWDEVRHSWICRGLFWDVCTQEYAHQSIAKLWGVEKSFKLTIEEKRRTVFKRGLPKLTKRPNARKVNFKGFLSCLLMVLGLVEKQSVSVFFKPEHSFHFITKLESWEPIDEVGDNGKIIESKSNLFYLRNKLAETLTPNDIREREINWEVRLETQFVFQTLYPQKNDVELDLDYIFFDFPVVSPKEFSNYIFVQSFAKVFFKGLVAEFEEENVRVLLFLHPLNQASGKIERWEKPLPRLSSYMEKQESYSISMGVLIHSHGTLFTYSKWLVFDNFGSNEIMDSGGEIQAYVLVKNLIESFEFKTEIYICPRNLFLQHVSSSEEKVIAKAQFDLRTSRANLRGLLAEFIAGFILSSHKKISLKIRQKTAWMESDFDLIGMDKIAGKITLVVVEVKDISKGGIVEKKGIRTFISNLAATDFIKVCKDLFEVKDRAPIEIKAYLVTTRFFSSDDTLKAMVNERYIEEKDVPAYIDSLKASLPENTTINYIASEQMRKIASKMKNDQAMKDLARFWEKIEWFEGDLGLSRNI